MAEVERVLTETEETGGTTQILALADVLGAVSKLGPAEREACLKILTAFAEYANSRPELLSHSEEAESRP